MQNQAMIEHERQTIAPLVNQLTEGLDAEATAVLEGTALNTAVNLRRGLPCGRGVTGMCIDCTEIGTTTPICEYREEQGLPGRPTKTAGTTLYTVDL